LIFLLLPFNTIPPGGWSTSGVAVSNDIEYLYVSSVSPTDNYYDVYTTHVTPTDTSDNREYYAGDNFPDCVRYSGFRLPTQAEFDNRPQGTSKPPNMTAYAQGVSNDVNQENYDGGKIQVQDGTCAWWCETVYVRPVGTLDACDACGGIIY